MRAQGKSPPNAATKWGQTPGKSWKTHSLQFAFAGPSLIAEVSPAGIAESH